MRVAIVQTGLKGEMEENLSRAMKLARDCAPVDLVIFPELFLSGYGDELKGQALRVQSILDSLRRLCSELGAGVICGLAEEEGGRLYNTAFVLEAGGSVARYRKINLFPGLDDPFSA
ncbi:MAG TPA: carbon-nitrogen hydrolase family protein, partial [Thermodesulfatator sp.]|nr:carbon-nitrogen hydrolase family protein [Thermodesulfatator sp.]